MTIEIIIGIILFLIAGYFFASLFSKRKKVSQRYHKEVSPLEPKIYMDAPDDVVNAIRSHRKVEAIKLYRNFASVGLKEAKEAVEFIEANLDKIS